MELDFLREKLDKREKQGNLRTLKSDKNLVDFVSNDYLGLSVNQELQAKISYAFQSGNYKNGGAGSRLLSGNYDLYNDLENELCSVFKSESTLIFNSGYSANQALVSSIAEKGDTILYDLLAHVCLKEGAWLSKADSAAFRHNDLNDLEARLSRAKGRCFVLTESVFSMDGDHAPLRELLDLCDRFGAYLIVDEAHSTGCYGALGAGVLVSEGLQDRVFARVYTFGKAMGVHGAAIAGSKILTDYLINFGRPFIYTTSLPPHSVVSIQQSFSYLQEHQELQDCLRGKVELFRTHWKQSMSDTAIQPVLIGNNQRSREISSSLQQKGFDVRAILSPTVQRGTERLRISLHVHNTDEDIIALCECLNTWI